MNVDAQKARSIFLEAVEKHAPDQWGNYLDAACGQDPELRRRVEVLLRAHEQTNGLLDASGPIPSEAAHEPSEGPGTIVGPYKLIERIGEGGFGVVYMAEQTQPVHRKVALKILKPGMDTRQVVARFEAERQALALMDHPNIAKVLDVGATCHGRPYFAMELVKGVSISEFCDQNHLGLRERLELFVSACSAVQHAHQKAIIHRDLKPSNVLVARYDDKPVVKVIDFGVAKAIGQRLTEHSLHTGFWAVVGTLEYMSPEQASLNQLDVDTRTDVYSLGILLYELLTGTTPLEHQRVKEAGMLEALRIIREEEAPTLSERLGTTAELPSIASRRGLAPAKLATQVRGELNWIVMKALEKDRERRYPTATDFAADVERYLADEPVQAHPPSAAYRFRKFARRNKGAVLAVAAIFLLLVAGITGTTWGLLRAEDAREAEVGQRMLAETAARSERTAKIAEAEQRTRAEEAQKKAVRDAAVAAAINEFLNKDLLQLSSPLGQVHQGLTPDANLKLRTVLLRAAQQVDGKFVEEPEVQMQIRETIGTALYQVGDYKGALTQFQKVVPYYQKSLGPNHEKTLLAELRLATMHRRLASRDIAVRLLEQNLEKHKAALGPTHAQTIFSMHELALAYGTAGPKEKSLPLAEEMLELQKRQFGPTHTNTLVAMHNVATLYQQQKQLDKAVPLFEEALAGMRTKLAALHPERLNTTVTLARAYYLAEQIDKAVALSEEVLPQFKTAYGGDDTKTLGVFDTLIGYFVDVGRCDKAEALLTSSQSGGAKRPIGVNPANDAREKRHRDLIRRMKPAADKYQGELAEKNGDHPDTLAARQAFAVALRIQKRNSAAAFHLTAVLDARQRLLLADVLDTQLCRLELGTIRFQQKEYAKAEPLLLDAYASLKRQDAKAHLAQAAQGLVQLYDGWGMKDKAMEWRSKLAEEKKR